MTVQVRSVTGSSATSSNTIAVTKPAGTIAGDLIVVYLDANSAGETWTAPDASWTALGANTYGATFSHVAITSEPASWTFTRTSGLNGTVAVAACIMDWASVTFGDTLTRAGTNPHVFASQTAVSPNSMFLQLASAFGNVTWTAPGGTTKHLDSLGIGFIGSDIVTGASGTRSWTASGSPNAGHGSVIIAPSGVIGSNPANIRVVYNSNRTFTVPPDVTSIDVECEGGGAGGGNGSALFVGGGGGGGAYAKSTLTVTPGSTHSIIVAAQVAALTAGNVSSFGTGPLVRAAGGSPGATAGGLSAGSGGAGGTVAGSIGTTRTAGSAGVNGGAGGAGAPPLGGAGGAQSTLGSAPGGGGGGGAILSVAGGGGAKGQVVVTFNTPDAVGKDTLSLNRSATQTLNAVGEGLATSTSAITKPLPTVLGEGLSSGKIHPGIFLTATGEGLTSMTKVYAAVRTFNLAGKGDAYRGPYAITRRLDAVGEGLASSTKAVIAYRSFSVTGKGLITEVHPVQAFRTFNLKGVGVIPISGPNASTITVPIDEIPDGGAVANTYIFPILD